MNSGKDILLRSTGKPDHRVSEKDEWFSPGNGPALAFVRQKVLNLMKTRAIAERSPYG